MGFLAESIWNFSPEPEVGLPGINSGPSRPVIPTMQGESLSHPAWRKPMRSLSMCVRSFAFALAAAAVAAAAQPVVVFIATGGTIAMKIDPVKKAIVPAISGEDLLATVPDVGKYAKVEVNNISNVPSGYMDPVRW